MEELKAAIAEVRRERTVRASVYPRLVDLGKLTQAEADRRASALLWAEAYLHKLMLNWQAISEMDARRAPTVQTIRD